MYYYDNPPVLYHQPYRPAHYIEMATRASKNIHLHKQATSLLLYYADNADGFRPAAKTIQRKTNIKSNKISEIRQALVDRGLILYRQKTFIILNWQRISTFAALTNPIPIPRIKKSRIDKRRELQRLFCVSIKDSDLINNISESRKLKDIVGHGSLKALSPIQQEIFIKILNMTEHEYEEWLSYNTKTGKYESKKINYIDNRDDVFQKEICESINARISDIPMSQREFDYLIDQCEMELSQDYEPLPF